MDINTALMGMKLYILRHGEAAEHGDPHYTEDERPLTEKGIQRTRQLAHALRLWNISFDVILTSPLVRARQTAEIIARGLRLEKQLELTGHLTPAGSMKELVDQIKAARPKSALLVGHEPYLSGFVSLLCIGAPNLPLKLKKGALCRLQVETLTCGRCAILDWLLQPRLLG
jgi:phosphohistidine phosphatase